jgi:hypothetical protein
MELLKSRYDGGSQNTIPEPPFLIIRKGKSFWVESTEPSKCAATLQAFREGCFTEACCYDRTGGLWSIADAKLEQGPSILYRILPWRRIPVELRFGPRKQVDVREVVSRLTEVLQNDSEFCVSLRVPPAELLLRFESARTPAEVIRIASEHAG